MNGAEILCELLRRYQASPIFGNPGSTEAPFLDALDGEKEPEYILGLHESVAVGMADGLARATRKPAVVSVHTSVGTMNALGHIYNAFRDETPLIVIAANKETRLLGRDCFCEVNDLAAMTDQVCKWSWEVCSVEQIPMAVNRAFKVAHYPPQGPVFLSIPEDVLRQELPDAELHIHNLSEKVVYQANDEIIKVAAEKLRNTKKPLLIVGNQVGRENAVAEAVALAESFKIPVLDEDDINLTNVNFPHDHPLYHGYLHPDHPLLKSADLIFGLGNRMFLEFSWDRRIRLNPQVPTIHMNVSPWEVSKNQVITVPIISGIKQGLVNLMTELRVESKRSLPVAPTATKGWTGEFNVQNNLNSSQVGEVLHYIYHHYPVVIVDQSISCSRELLNAIKYNRPDSLYRTAGGCLGWAVAAGMGVALGNPGGRVISIIGDGGFMFAPQALWTAAHYQIPLTIVLLNNQGYSISNFMKKVSDINKYPGILEQPSIDICQLAAAQGITARRAGNPRELAEHLITSLNSPGPVLVEAVFAEETIAADLVSKSKKNE